MKSMKKIMIWGSNLFLDVLFDLKKGYICTADNCSFKLSTKFIVDNFSMKSLSSKKALNMLLKALRLDSNYDSAIIELGTVDMINILNEEELLDDFRNNLSQIITSLKYCGIKVYLVTLCPIEPLKYQFKNNIKACTNDIILIHRRINRAIKELAVLYGVEVIDDNKTISKNKYAYLSEDGDSINAYGHSLIEAMVSRKIV